MPSQQMWYVQNTQKQGDKYDPPTERQSPTPPPTLYSEWLALSLCLSTVCVWPVCLVETVTVCLVLTCVPLW